jgi:hypothetical protein
MVDAVPFLDGHHRVFAEEVLHRDAGRHVDGGSVLDATRFLRDEDRDLGELGRKSSRCPGTVSI